MANPSQVVGHRLGDMPVEPELRFAPRRAWPRIPGRAAWAGAAYSGSFRCCLFDRTMSCGAPVAAAVEGCLHNSTPPQRAWLGVLVLVPIGQGSNGWPAQPEILLARVARTTACWRAALGQPRFGAVLHRPAQQAPLRSSLNPSAAPVGQPAVTSCSWQRQRTASDHAAHHQIRPERSPLRAVRARFGSPRSGVRGSG